MLITLYLGVGDIYPTLNSRRLRCMACYHIIIRHASMRTGPALKRCHRTRKAAEAVQGQRGATGDRADYSLDPGQTLGVVECYDKG